MSKEIKIDFEHNMSSHCENGVTRNMLKHYGVELTESLVFGLGSGLFFAYFPFIKLNGAPVTSFRPMPGKIFSRVNKYIGAKVIKKKYANNPDKAMSDLDEILSQGTPVGMVVGVYHLTYFPAPLRFHFNAHNIVVFQKKDSKYLVSDPIMETPEWISYEDLKKVRYAKGTYKPKGRMYYYKSVNPTFNFAKAVEKSIRYTSKMMVKLPGPYIGVSGIHLLAKSIRKWPNKYNNKKASLYLCSVIRMQEEIGTGGAGFRFIYASFLQEVGLKFNDKELLNASEEMTTIGQLWRAFAVDAGRVCKLRPKDGETYYSIADKLDIIAEKEKALFKKLLKIKIV